MSGSMTHPMDGASESTPAAILEDFVSTGRLDPRSQLELVGTDEVAIVYLRATQPCAGSGRAFLRVLQSRAWRVHVRLPTREALPFWRRMRSENLIDDDPDELVTWNEFIGSIESQMKKPWKDDGAS